MFQSSCHGVNSPNRRHQRTEVHHTSIVPTTVGLHLEATGGALQVATAPHRQQGVRHHPGGMVADLTLAIAISILIDPALTRDRGHHDALDPDRFHLSLEAILPHGVVVGIGAGNRHQPRVEVDEEEVRVTQAILAIAIEVAAGTEAGVGAGTGGEGDTRSDV